MTIARGTRLYGVDPEDDDPDTSRAVKETKKERLKQELKELAPYGFLSTRQYKPIRTQIKYAEDAIAGSSTDDEDSSESDSDDDEETKARKLKKK